MQRLRLAAALLLSGLVLLMMSESAALGHKTRKKPRHRQHNLNDHGHSHGKKKKKKKKNDHGHSHGQEHGEEEDDHHGHAHGGPWSFGAGASISQSLGSSSGSIFHSRYFLLQSGHEGHDHSGGGEGGGDGGGSESSGGSSSSSFAPTIFGTVNYALASSWAANLNIGYTISSGLADPSIGVTKNGKLTKKWAIAYVAQATLPFSSNSRDIYKTSTITSAVRPSLQMGKGSLNLGASIALTWYSKTVIVEEDEEAFFGADDSLSPGLSLQHDHAHGPGGHGGGALGDIGDENSGTGDREFNRYTVESGYSYRLSNSFALSTLATFALVTHQFGPRTYESTASLPQVDYGLGPFTLSGALTLFGTDTSFVFPTTPGLTAGILYFKE